jgi:hypothetical protein
MKIILKLRGKLIHYFPERRHPRLGTQVKRPTYPKGWTKPLSRRKAPAPINLLKCNLKSSIREDRSTPNNEVTKQ